MAAVLTCFGCCRGVVVRFSTAVARAGDGKTNSRELAQWGDRMMSVCGSVGLWRGVDGVRSRRAGEGRSYRIG